MGKIFKRIWTDVKEYGIGIGAYIIYHFVAVHFWGASCPLVLTTGYPCPGCGMTRAVWQVLTLQWDKALNMNPLAFGWVFLAIWVFFFRYILGKNLKLTKILFWTLIVIMIVYYVCKMLTVFPNEVPYTYRQNNLLRNVLKQLGLK